MQALTKAAQAVAGKEALDVSNTAQLRDICLAAARIFGWTGESQVNVAVNNQVGVVVTEAKRKELQKRLRRLQELEDQERQLPANATPAPPPPSQMQAQANVVARNSPPGATTRRASIFIMPGGEGVRVPGRLASSIR